jgi:hypothetical protein
MTILDILQDYKKIMAKIEAVKRSIKILELKIISLDDGDGLKAHVITDMPLYCTGDNKIEQNMIKKEDIQTQINRLAIVQMIEEQKIQYADDSLKSLDTQARYIFEHEYIYRKKPQAVMIGMAQDLDRYISESNYYKIRRKHKKEFARRVIR